MAKYHRRLPVYLLIDCSESMAGDAFKAVKDGLSTMLSELKGNPMALETTALSIITFASKAKQIIPLSDLFNLNLPKLTMGTGTALGKALELWVNCMEKEVVKNSPDQKGDYKPICFILTDGEPTDNWEKIANKVKNEILGKNANIIGVACGRDADVTKLQKITNTVIAMNDTEPANFSEFFQWVTASVSTASQKVTGTNEGIDLPRLQKGLDLVKPGQEYNSPVSDRFVFLHSKCEKEGAFYIMRFEKQNSEKNFLGKEKKMYLGVAAHPVEDFDFEDGDSTKALQVSTESLLNSPPCPYCGNQAWALDSNCGHVFCIPGEGKHKCPWCGSVEEYRFATFDVGRGRG